MNNITQSVQRALHAYLFANVAALDFLEPEPAQQLYTSLLAQTAVVPNVLLKCPKATCVNSQDGNWRATARIELREAHDDTTEDQHFEHAGKLFALFATVSVADEISAAIQAVESFTVQQLTRKEQGWYIDGRLWVSYLEVELECCSATLA